MTRTFNVNGACRSSRHYMVDLSSRLAAVRQMVADGSYFTVNRARQYGKTTLLQALAADLRPEYIVVSMDFQRMSSQKFRTEALFAAAFAQDFIDKITTGNDLDPGVLTSLTRALTKSGSSFGLYELFRCLSDVCGSAPSPVVLIIDEVDTAANNQIFVDFLAQLRSYYLDRDQTPTFQSVILAGVYDVRNIRRKLRPDEEHRQNSPWNIAADFDIDMAFSASDIEGMLRFYEDDYHTGMNIPEIAGCIHDYTSGYPYLVSRICKIMDEKLAGTPDYPDAVSAWTRAGVTEAVGRLLAGKDPLFDSLIGRLNDYPELKDMIWRMLFQGDTITYNADDPAADMLLMFGFAKSSDGLLQIANRIFETRLYNYFLTLPDMQNGTMYRLAQQSRSQFTRGGQLDMELVLSKFTEHFDEIYGDRDAQFLEEDGRRYFMLYLKPIINGTGNYYVEARTRNRERTDLIVDYLGQQYIIELKIWRGNAYNERGEEQLLAYLDYYHLNRGYMLSFNFNKTKKIGVSEIHLGNKVLIEAVV